MSKLVRACAVALCVATSLAAGIAAAQIQSGVTRKSAPPSVALGVPVPMPRPMSTSVRPPVPRPARAVRWFSPAASRPALRTGRPAQAKDPVRREAVKDGAKETGPSARGAAAPAAATGEFAPAPGVLRANMPPVTGADAQSILKARVFRPTSTRAPPRPPSPASSPGH